MSKTHYKNISTLYPKIKGDYENGLDYDSSILESPFTLSKCKDIVSTITENAGNRLIAVINLKRYVIPLILSILMDNKFHYLFIYCDSDDKYKQILINAIIRIGKTNKCELREGPVTTSDIDAKDMVYFGVDEIPIKAAKRDGIKLPERSIVLVVTPKGDRNLTLIRRESMSKEDYEVEEIKLSQLTNQDESYYQTDKNLARFDRKKTSPLSGENPERIGKKVKEISSEEIKVHTKTEEVPKKKRELSSEEEAAPLRRGRNTSVENKSKARSKSLPPKGKKLSPNENPKNRYTGDEKYNTTARPNHANLINSKDPRIPKKGGWIEDYKGITTFYIMGADKLKEPSKKLTEENYTNSLMEYLRNLLSLFIDDEKAIEIMTTNKDLQKLWVKAWTHETYDIEENYETLETVGDGAVGYSFISFILDNDPTVDEGELTALKSKSCDKNAFRQISWELKMDTWLRFGGGVKSNTNTAEDVVESFCGVLQVAGTYYLEKKDITFVPGSGIKYVYDFIEFLYGKVVFSPEMYISDPKSALLQAAEGLVGGIGIGNAIVEEFDIKESGNHTLTLSWSDKAVNALKELDKKQKKIIVKVEAGSKKTVIAKGYFEAIKELDNRNSSIRWLRNIKKENKWKTYNESLIKKVMKRLRKEYGDDATLELYMPKSTTSISGAAIMLLAILPDKTRKGKRVKLGVVTGDDPEEIRVRVLTEYANGK
jgi:dsRNA-specific ribonuclease